MTKKENQEITPAPFDPSVTPPPPDRITPASEAPVPAPTLPTPGEPDAPPPLTARTKAEQEAGRAILAGDAAPAEPAKEPEDGDKK